MKTLEGMEELTKVTPHCPVCGSSAVSTNADTEWDSGTEKWVVVNEYDSGYCRDCNFVEGDVDFEWRKER